MSTPCNGDELRRCGADRGGAWQYLLAVSLPDKGQQTQTKAAAESAKVPRDARHSRSDFHSDEVLTVSLPRCAPPLRDYISDGVQR